MTDRLELEFKGIADANIAAIERGRQGGDRAQAYVLVKRPQGDKNRRRKRRAFGNKIVAKQIPVRNYQSKRLVLVSLQTRAIAAICEYPY